MRNRAPIGVTDSGVGGLSVLREALRVLPRESFLYFGDNGNAPYGTKTPEEIFALGSAAAKRLRDLGVKALMIACNTTTAVAFERISELMRPMPVVGICPPVAETVRLARGKKALILATPATLAQPSLRKMAEPFGDAVLPCPCPGLVELIEAGGDGVAEYMRALLPKEICAQVGAAALGCTHYPFAREAIGRVLGADIPLVDGARGAVLNMLDMLRARDLLSDARERDDAARVEICTSGDAARVLPLCDRLLYGNGEI